MVQRPQERDCWVRTHVKAFAVQLVPGCRLKSQTAFGVAAAADVAPRDSRRSAILTCGKDSFPVVSRLEART